MNSQVQIFTHPPRVVHYTPEGFPNVETWAELVFIEGDTLTVDKGYEQITITRAQVLRITSRRSAELGELLEIECEEYDRAETE